MRKLPFSAIVAVLALVITFALQMTNAAAKKEFSFGAEFGNGAGMSASQELESTEVLFNTLSDNYDMNIRMKKYSSYDDIVLDAVKGKVDMFMMFDKPIVFDNWNKLKVWPLFTIAVNGSARSTPCFWVLKGGGIKAPGDLTGKNLVVWGVNPWFFIKIRDLLYRNGIDVPLWMVFDKITRVSNKNSAYIAVAMGNADVVFGYDYEKSIMKLLNAQVVKKLDKCLCSGKDHGNVVIVMNRRTTTEADYKNFQSVIKDFISREDEFVKKYPQLQTVYKLKTMAKAEFIPADGTELNEDLALYRKSLKNGWMTEANYIYSIMAQTPKGQSTKVVGDYNICKTICSGKKFECVDNCMK
jgi:hypothetical protein